MQRWGKDLVNNFKKWRQHEYKQEVNVLKDTCEVCVWGRWVRRDIILGEKWEYQTIFSQPQSSVHIHHHRAQLIFLIKKIILFFGHTMQHVGS